MIYYLVGFMCGQEGNVLRKLTILPSNRAGLGVVIKDNVGKLVMTLGNQFKQWDIIWAEFLAAATIKETMEDWMLDLDGIIVESDNVFVIE